MKFISPGFLMKINLGNSPERASIGISEGAQQREKVVLDGENLCKALAEVATNAWKAKGRIGALTAVGDTPEFRKLERNIDSILQELETIGIEVKGHTGEPYDYGDALRVVTSETRDGIDREVVTETIRPTVKLQGRILQHGEVVIATPARQEG